MFETSSIRRDRKIHPLTLAISVTLHIAAIVAVTFVTVWDVTIPDNAPVQVVGLQVSAGPPPPIISRGNPEAARETRSDPAPEKETQPRTATVPVEIPLITAPLDTQVGPAGEGSEEPFGHRDGAVGGDPEGDILGTGDGGEESAGISDEPYDVGQGVHAPVIVQRVAPAYPPLLERMGMAGTVQLECVISRSGVLTDIRVIKAAHPLFAEAAINAVKQWKFLPGSLNGRAVATRFDFTVTFNVQR